MWKNKIGSKNLKSVYYVYSVDGLNQNKLINTLIKGGITLYNVNKISPSKMTFSISANQNEKLFAIIDNICYTNIDNNLKSVETTVKSGIINLRKNKGRKPSGESFSRSKAQCGYDLRRIRTLGKGLPFYLLLKNLGVAVGILFFIILTTFSNDYIFGFKFTGSGSVYERQTMELLRQNGVDVNKRFSSFDLNYLSDKILQNSPYLTFVQCYKKGNLFVVELRESKESPPTLDCSVKKLLSTVDGVVNEVKVYRGTALVQTGDTVKVGDVLVDGYSEIKDGVVETNVLAIVTVTTTVQYQYFFKEQNCQDYALLLAEGELGDKQITNSAVTVNQTDGGFNYLVDLDYSVVITAG